MGKSIYFDNAATTHPHPAVLEKMREAAQLGNPGSPNALGRSAATAIKESRGTIASFLGCEPEQLFFTSGATEANHTAIRGAVEYMRFCGMTHILVSAAEHKSVLTATHMLPDDFEVEVLPVSKNGKINMSTLKSKIRPDTGMVCAMYINNETGAENPVESIGTICRERGVLFHCDCTQAAGSVPVDLKKIQCTSASFSGHKFHGPFGIGILYLKCPGATEPLVPGQPSQEAGFRGGTPNTPAILALATAAEIAADGLLNGANKRISTIKQRFYNELISDELMKSIVHVNGPSPQIPGKILNFRLDGVDAETLILMLDAAGVYISAGAACNGSAVNDSHVLIAMGLTPEQVRSSVRVSFSRYNMEHEAVAAAQVITSCVKKLRGLAE